jgi:hypothetical protein
MPLTHVFSDKGRDNTLDVFLSNEGLNIQVGTTGEDSHIHCGHIVLPKEDVKKLIEVLTDYEKQL